MHQPSPPRSLADDDPSSEAGRAAPTRTPAGSRPGTAESLGSTTPPGEADRAASPPPTAARLTGPPAPGATPGRPETRPPGAPTHGAPGAARQPVGELPPAHKVLTCVALPGLAISAEDGQLAGRGLEGFYRAGRRLLSRCLLRIGGREPLALQAGMAGADRARFTGTLRSTPHGSPDPDLLVERVRSADGTERITLHSAAARPLRLPVEVALGTDLADLGAIAAGRAGPELPAGVHASGLRWTGSRTAAHVTADPPASDAFASAGLLRWELEVPPGGSASIELRVRMQGAPPLRAVSHAANGPLASARAAGDDPRGPALLRTSIKDLRALLLRDPVQPTDVCAAAGAPWRCGPAPADALAAARMALPLGTGLAAGTLRSLARTQITGPGPQSGMIPGPRRDAGPHLPPSCTGTEATLLFPVLLAEARRWGLPERETQELLPAAERCLAWLRNTAGDGREGVYLPDPRPDAPLRSETQAHAHRAAVLGADLLDACGRPGADALRQWAGELRQVFREDFRVDAPGGGRPAAARRPDGTLVPHLGGWAVHLLDTGLLGGGELAPGLCDKQQTEQLARLLGGPAMDTGWGLRGLTADDPGHNPFGHRAGAVRVHETALAVAGLAAAGHEREAASLLHGVLGAAQAFDYRLPEMYAGRRRAEGSAPLPHPAACRPAATAAAAGVLLLATLVGLRPDAPAGTVTLRPMSSAPLGEIVLTGLRVAGAPFSVRVSRLGMAMVEEAAEELQLGV